MNEIRECLSVPDAVQDAAGAPTLAGSRSGRQAGVGGVDERDLARRRGRGRSRLGHVPGSYSAEARARWPERTRDGMRPLKGGKKALFTKMEAARSLRGTVHQTLDSLHELGRLG